MRKRGLRLMLRTGDPNGWGNNCDVAKRDRMADSRDCYLRISGSICRAPAPPLKVLKGPEMLDVPLLFERHSELVMNRRFGDGGLRFDEVSEELSAAHEHAFNNRNELMASEQCGCFHYMATFGPSEVREWIDKGQTAMCPRCEIDSVIGSASSLPLTEESLQKMQKEWF